VLELDSLKCNLYGYRYDREQSYGECRPHHEFRRLRRRRGNDFGGNRESLQTNPVVVRKILKLLEREGLVALCQGRHGGVGLRRPASRITLGQIYKAVESETGVFAMRSQVHEGCAVACAMKRRLGPIFNAANDAVEQALSKTSLAELVRGVG